MLSALCLFFGRIAFEGKCPDLIRQFPELSSFTDQVDPDSDEAITRRSYFATLWKKKNNSKDGRSLPLAMTLAFITCFVLSFLSGAIALFLFVLQ